MFRKWLIWIGIGMLLLGIKVSLAQETAPSLRELADANHIHIGTAVGVGDVGSLIFKETASREFNMLTPGNEGKACYTERKQGEFTFQSFDKLVDFAEKNNMMIRGHTLVWHQCVPGWVQNATFTRDEAIDALRNHIYTEVGRYKGRIAIWDVVNEVMAVDGSGLREAPWRTLIGDDYVELAFRFAHEADPDALLFLNDYNIEGVNAKSDAVYAMVKDFQARGVPIDGVGFQSHFELGKISAPSIGRNMDRFGELGLQVQITELDIRYPGEVSDTILRRQAGDYRKVMQTCLDHSACTAFVVWGVSDLHSWLRNDNLGFYKNPDVDPLLFDEEYQPKPAYFAVLDALARHAGLPPILTDDEVTAMTGQRPPTTTALPAPTKTDPAQLAPDSVPGQVYYAPFPVSITLDGDNSDWANIPRVTIDKGPTLPPGNDTSMTFAAAADDSNIYFLADVKDSHLVYGTHDPASAWYQEDSVEFYINATGDLKLEAYKPGVAQIGILAANITNTDPDQPIIGGGNSADSKVKAVVVKTGDGYRIEAAVPLVTKVWSIKPAQLGTIGFQVHLNGAAETDRDTKLIWSVYDTQDQSYTNPSLFGQLIFWDKTK